MITLDQANDLEELFAAYESLQVLASGNNCDSGNVSAVLAVLNKEFQRVNEGIQNARKKGGVKLQSVNQVSTI